MPLDSDIVVDHTLAEVSSVVIHLGFAIHIESRRPCMPFAFANSVQQ
jgi:hypothetical protein